MKKRSKRYTKILKTAVKDKKLTAKEIFSNYRKNEMNAKEFITNFKEKLARSLIFV